VAAVCLFSPFFLLVHDLSAVFHKLQLWATLVELVVFFNWLRWSCSAQTNANGCVDAGSGGRCARNSARYAPAGRRFLPQFDPSLGAGLGGLPGFWIVAAARALLAKFAISPKNAIGNLKRSGWK